MSDRSESRQDRYDDYWDDYHDHYNDYWHGDDEWWALAAGLTIGAAIATLPPRYETVYVSNTTYYYANGSYYTTAPGGGYVMAAPPTGAVVQQPPAQVVNVTVNDKDYGYSNGAYYEVQEPEEEGGDPTFKTVEAPVGAKVDHVPDGAESKTVDGIVYFVFDNTYYRPYYSGSEVVYMVVDNPESAAQGPWVCFPIFSFFDVNRIVAPPCFPLSYFYRGNDWVGFSALILLIGIGIRIVYLIKGCIDALEE